MKKRYYRTIKFFGKAGMNEAIWHCSSDTVLSLNCDVIIPLNRKPQIGTFDFIKEGA